jgi:hypothetical protein
LEFGCRFHRCSSKKIIHTHPNACDVKKKRWKTGLPCDAAGMKKYTLPSRSQFAVLRQICDLIPCHLVSKLARKTGVDMEMAIKPGAIKSRNAGF